jgi:tetratricopeptide (TPR) repeat protein
MIFPTLASGTENKLVTLPRRFEIDSPTENPLVSVTASTLSPGPDNTIDWSWNESKTEPGLDRSNYILAEVLNRCKKDVERFPENVHARLNYGLALLNQGHTEDAEKEFRQALRIAPGSNLATASLARALILQNRLEEAEQLYETLLASNPKEPTWLVNLAYIALRRGDISSASRRLSRAIDIDEGAVLPRFLSSLVALSSGNSREAIHHLKVASRTDTMSSVIYQALGVAYAIAGDGERAVRALRTALNLTPNMGDAVHALSNVFAQRKEFSSQIQLLNAYLEKCPQDLVARERLAEAHFRLAQYSAARIQNLSILRGLTGTGVEVLQRKARVLNNIGVCYGHEGDDKRSEEWLSRSIQLNPTFEPVEYYNLARVYIRTKRFDQAHQILDVCETRSPNDTTSVEIRVLALAAQSRYEEAIALLEKRFAVGQDSPRMYAELSWLLIEIKRDSSKGCEVSREGFAKYGHTPELTNNLAYALLEDGKPEQARKILESAPTQLGASNSLDDVALTATWGLLHLYEGKLVEGREHYQAAERLARTFGDSQLASAVKQKMYLEVAKFHLAHGNRKGAEFEISRGLDVRGGRDYFEHQLRSLRAKVEKPE